MNEFDCWKEGAMAFMRGRNDTSNPYERQSTQWGQWLAGWQAARAHDFLTKHWRKEPEGE